MKEDMEIDSSPSLMHGALALIRILIYPIMKKSFTNYFLPPLFGLFLSVFGLDVELLGQCNTIEDLNFTPVNTVHCGAPLTIDFQSFATIDSTPVWLATETAPANFQSDFSFSFSTENNGCYYYLEISGYFTLWSNTDEFFDAFGRFDISTNELISQGVSNKLSITSPLFITPGSFSTDHTYRYYYEGDGSTVNIDFSDNQLDDNSGNMSFSWHVVPCFTTQWELGDGTTSNEAEVTHTYTTPGTYPIILEITDELNDCSEIVDGLVEIYPEETTNLSAVICSGETYTLGADTYSATGAYSAIFPTVNGCDSTVHLNLIVLEPIASVLPPAPITCAVPSVLLDGNSSSSGPGISYQWTGPAAGCINGDPTEAMVIAACTGAYQLEVSETGIDGTQCTVTTQITVWEDVETPEIILPPTIELPCDIGITELTAIVFGAGSNLSYSWQSTNGTILSGATSPIAMVEGEGIYQLEVVNEDNGCKASQEIEVIINDQMEWSWEIVHPTCQDPTGSITLEVLSGGTPPYIYSIDGGIQFELSPEFSELQEGPYELIIQDGAACETAVQVVTLTPPTGIELAIEPEITLQTGSSIPLPATANLPIGAIESIQWTPAMGLSCTNCLNPVASPGTTTEYLLEVWDIHGCYDAVTTRVLVASSEIFVPNAFSPNGDGYNDEFLLFSNAGSVSMIESFIIFDRWGQMVFQGDQLLPNSPASGWDGSFQGKKADTGVYTWIAEVVMQDGTVTTLKGGVLLMR
jgi:gliding motility-associated-like protein